MELNNARQLANELIRTYNLDYRFEFDNSKRRFGCCSPWRRCITLSAPLTLLNDEAHVKGTILHEIAHVLAYKKTGFCAHDKAFYNACLLVGSTPQRCYGEEVISPEGKYKSNPCGGCGHVFTKFRKVWRRRFCLKCYKDTGIKHFIEYRLNDNNI